MCTCSSMVQSDTTILLGPASQLCQCVISKSTELKVRKIKEVMKESIHLSGHLHMNINSYSHTHGIMYTYAVEFDVPVLIVLTEPFSLGLLQCWFLQCILYNQSCRNVAICSIAFCAGLSEYSCFIIGN